MFYPCCTAMQLKGAMLDTALNKHCLQVQRQLASNHSPLTAAACHTFTGCS